MLNKLLKLSVFLLLAILITYNIFSKNPSDAMKLPLGSSYQQVISLAGIPSYETDGTLWVEPQYKKDPNQIVENCIRELWYENWTKLVPNKYSFCFDTKNSLVNKYHWTSW